MGFFITTFYSLNDPDELLTIDQLNIYKLFQKKEVLKLLFLTALIILIFATLIVLFFKEKPNYISSAAIHVEKENYSEALNLLVNNRNYRFLLLSFSLLFGTNILFLSYIHNLLSGYDITTH